jgi:hypothetical protein
MAPGLHYRWKKRPLSRSRTRGRPVPAEMLPALSPQPWQWRTGREAASLASSRRMVCTVIEGTFLFDRGPCGVCLAAHRGGRFSVYTYMIRLLYAFVKGYDRLFYGF